MNNFRKFLSDKTLKIILGIFILFSLVQCSKSCSRSRQIAKDNIEIAKKDSTIARLKTDSALMENKMASLIEIADISKKNLDKFAETAKAWKSQTTVKISK